MDEEPPHLALPETKTWVMMPARKAPIITRSTIRAVGGLLLDEAVVADSMNQAEYVVSK